MIIIIILILRYVTANQVYVRIYRGAVKKHMEILETILDLD